MAATQHAMDTMSWQGAFQQHMTNPAHHDLQLHAKLLAALPPNTQKTNPSNKQAQRTVMASSTFVLHDIHLVIQSLLTFTGSGDDDLILRGWDQ